MVGCQVMITDFKMLTVNTGLIEIHFICINSFAVSVSQLVY